MSTARFTRRAVLAAPAMLTLAARAAPAPFVYLLPAPREAIVFAPLLLAEADGHFARAGLAVTFEQVSGGGAKVGAALAAGRGDAGGGLGDTATILRAKGVPVRGIALLGRHSFLTLITAADLPLDAAAWRSAAIGVPSFQDVSYYALKALLRRLGLPPEAVQVRAAATPDLVAGLARRELRGIVGTVDWGVQAERSGLSLAYHPLDPYYPALAQGIMASDATIAHRPAELRAFVRAVLAALEGLSRDPDRAARRYVELAPGAGYGVAEAARVFRLLARHVYGHAPGAFDAAVMARAVQAAKGEGLVPPAAVATGSFTNQFVRR
jgi:NitT/TauT family transport system substrate-binding protein